MPKVLLVATKRVGFLNDNCMLQFCLYREIRYTSMATAFGYPGPANYMPQLCLYKEVMYMYIAISFLLLLMGILI